MQQLLRRTVSRLRAIASEAKRRLRKPDPALERAGELFGDHRFNAAAATLEKSRHRDKRTAKLLLRCYASAQRFDDLFSAYEAMPAAVRKDLTSRHLYLLAAANLERFDIVVKVIEGVLEEPDSREAAQFLSKTLPFTAKLLPASYEAATDRILRHADELAANSFSAVLRCTHDLREKGYEAEASRLERALRSVPLNPRMEMKLDILNAQTHFWAGRYDLQLAALNDALVRCGIAPVSLNDETAPVSCGNLTCVPKLEAHVRGPLVSILMPAYNSSQTIGYALESLRNQTYRDIEIIVVDDASRDDTTRIVAQCSAQDPRIRLISLDRNSGPFIARNTALASAIGEFATNQDADDWAHPQKIEAMVAELQRDGSLMAAWVDQVRCSSQQGFRALGGYIRPDTSSLMFRRKPVLETIGWYDSVRAAGDGEFFFRIRRAFGRGSIRRLDQLLSFMDWSEGSVTGGGTFRIDSELGLLSPTRSAYLRSFSLWHEIADYLYMPFPLEARPFTAPQKLLPL